MGLWSNLKAAFSPQNGQAYRVAGRQVVCPHCTGTTFQESEAQLNTAFMTLLNLDAFNKSATTLVCDHCGRIEWFLNRPNPV